MLKFKQFVTELAREDVRLSPSEVREMTARFGEKALQMGPLEEDGSMPVPVACIVEASRAVGTRTLTEAAESMNGEQIASILKAGEALVDQVIKARERRLREMIRTFQDEPEGSDSHEQWNRIEHEVFGVQYHD